MPSRTKPPSPGSPSPETIRKRKTVNLTSERVENVASTNYPLHYPKEPYSWSVNQFSDNLQVEFHKSSPHDIVFSLVNIDASLANAFRRILLVEIPTLAFEDVFVNQNTSIIQDEVLAHRLGLVPLKGSEDGMRWLRWRPSLEDYPTGDGRSTDFNTVQAELKVQCRWREGGEKRSNEDGETDPDVLYENAHIYARDIVFKPVGQQESTYFTESRGPLSTVNPDILLAKLRPNQEIDIQLHAVKGIGADHAKFTPVATASYRLLPTINITSPILGASAHRFAACFPPGVIEVKKSPEKADKGQERAVVKDAVRDTVTRECLRHDEFREKVKLGREREHFIFSVESVGQLRSDDLFEESVKILKRKCERLKVCLGELRDYG